MWLVDVGRRGGAEAGRTPGRTPGRTTAGRTAWRARGEPRGEVRGEEEEAEAGRAGCLPFPVLALIRRCRGGDDVLGVQSLLRVLCGGVG